MDKGITCSKDWIAKGTQCKNPSQAQEHFNQAILHDPNNPSIYYEIGLFYKKIRNSELAIYYFLEATKRKHVNAFNELYEIETHNKSFSELEQIPAKYRELGLFNFAQAFYKKLIQEYSADKYSFGNKNNLDKLHYESGLTYLAEGGEAQIEKAKQHFKQSSLTEAFIERCKIKYTKHHSAKDWIDIGLHYAGFSCQPNVKTDLCFDKARAMDKDCEHKVQKCIRYYFNYVKKFKHYNKEHFGRWNSIERDSKQFYMGDYLFRRFFKEDKSNLGLYLDTAVHFFSRRLFYYLPLNGGMRMGKVGLRELGEFLQYVHSDFDQYITRLCYEKSGHRGQQLAYYYERGIGGVEVNYIKAVQCQPNKEERSKYAFSLISKHGLTDTEFEKLVAGEPVSQPYLNFCNAHKHILALCIMDQYKTDREKLKTMMSTDHTIGKMLSSSKCSAIKEIKEFLADSGKRISHLPDTFFGKSEIQKTKTKEDTSGFTKKLGSVESPRYLNVGNEL